MRRPSLIPTPRLLHNARPSPHAGSRHARRLKPRRIHPPVQAAYRLRISKIPKPPTMGNELLRSHPPLRRPSRKRRLSHLAKSRTQETLRPTRRVPILRLPNHRLDDSLGPRFDMASPMAPYRLKTRIAPPVVVVAGLQTRSFDFFVPLQWTIPQQHQPVFSTGPPI